MFRFSFIVNCAIPGKVVAEYFKTKEAFATLVRQNKDAYFLGAPLERDHIRNLYITSTFLGVKSTEVFRYSFSTRTVANENVYTIELKPISGKYNSSVKLVIFSTLSTCITVWEYQAYPPWFFRIFAGFGLYRWVARTTRNDIEKNLKKLIYAGER